MQNNSPKPIIIAVKAIILHTFGGPGKPFERMARTSPEMCQLALEGRTDIPDAPFRLEGAQTV